MNEIEERRKEILHEICKISFRKEVVHVSEVDFPVWFQWQGSVVSDIDIYTKCAQGWTMYKDFMKSWAGVSLLGIKEKTAKSIMQVEAPTLDLCWLIKNDKVSLPKPMYSTKYFRQEGVDFDYTTIEVFPDVEVLYGGVKIDLHIFNKIERHVIDYYLKGFITRQTERNLKKQEEEKKVKRQALEQLLCGTTSNEEGTR